MLSLKPTPSTRARRDFKKSEKGMAIIESIPVLFMLVLVFNFSLGFFGAVQSGILNSIASYNYTVETFRFRSNLMYFRPGDPSHYNGIGNRVHVTVREGTDTTSIDDDTLLATVRGITFNYSPTDAKRSLAGRLDEIGGDAARNYGGREQAGNVWKATSDYTPDQGSSIQTPKIWIKTVYGICVNADCGDGP